VKLSKTLSRSGPRTNHDQSILFFILIHSLRERRTPEVLFRLQALSPDLLLGGALASSDPSDSELCVRLVVLNHDLVANLYLASVTTQFHTTVADIESMREMAIFTPGDPDSHWDDRFGSLRLPLAFAKSRHVPASLRVPYVMVCAIWWQKVGCYCRNKVRRERLRISNHILPVGKMSPYAQRLVFCAVPQITCLNGHPLKEEDRLFRVSTLK
jgi:hypothetical protein